jgi:hypothetical protein
LILIFYPKSLPRLAQRQTDGHVNIINTLDLPCFQDGNKQNLMKTNIPLTYLVHAVYNIAGANGGNYPVPPPEN